MTHFLYRCVVLSAMAVAAWLAGTVGCARDDTCFGRGQPNVKQYEDCQRLCEGGNQTACERRGEVEQGLSTACHRRSSKPACRAMCLGRLKDPAACRQLRALP